jgi:predicted ATPase
MELKPITLLFGANSSGKTALLKSLLMLKQTCESSDRGRSLCFNGYADLGSYDELIYNHDSSNSLEVELEWKTSEPFALQDHQEGARRKPLTTSNVQYLAEWKQRGEVSIDRLFYECEALKFGVIRDTEDRYKLEHDDRGNVLGNRRIGKPWPWPSPESCYALPRVASRDWPNANLLEFNHQFEILMDRIKYVGPMRSDPRREYLWTGESPTSIGRDGAGAVEALLSQFRARPTGSKTRKRRVSDLLDSTGEWLKKFGLAEKFEIVPIDKTGRYYEVRLAVSGKTQLTALPDVGFGLSQVLPVIVQLLFAPEGSILLFEQPEIHLHPRAAALLADLFLEVSEKRKVQIVVETHSEYLLTRLQRRVAEASLPYANPDNIAIYFCELTQDGAVAQPIKMNLFGHIENWPKGFFGDTIGDLHEMTMAVALRKQKGEKA